MRIIINADDFGLSQGVNQAIFELAEHGCLSSTTVMANMPYADQVIELLKLKNIGIGLHINLTQGKPISDPNQIPTLVNSKGFFLEKDGFKNALDSKKINGEDIFKEIQAQYNWLFEKIDSRLDHFDSHQGTNKFPIVLKNIIKLKKILNRKIGLRIYNKYYLINSGEKYEIIHPNIFSVQKFGLKRVLVEMIFDLRKKRIGKFFIHPDGLLLAKSHTAIDLFNQIILFNNSKSFNYDFEIAFHPAANTEELPITKLVHSRVEEFNFLKSNSFKDFIHNFNLTNYSQLS